MNTHMRTSEELEKSLEEKSELVSISAHELRTSISALRWILQMLSSGDLGPVTDKQKDMLEKALLSSDRMKSVISSLLAFNHADESALSPVSSTADFTRVINETVLEFGPQAQSKQMKIEAKTPAALPPVACDPGLLRAVISILIENAIKYGNPESTITASLSHTGKDITASIHDMGTIIPAEEHQVVFTKFFRSQSVKNETPGSGLGLYIAAYIVKRAHGTLSFESTESAGTTFSVSIPAIA